ncbi:hypothetical protein BLSTO_02903 [Blastocystis sp. subtype 1]
MAKVKAKAKTSTTQKYTSNRSIRILDETKHVKEVLLDIHDYCPPVFLGDSPIGVSPFIPVTERKHVLDELKRKLQHIRSDAMDRKRMRCGLKQKEPTWSEEYVKRSVKKKLEKSMFCEVCGLAIPSYSSHACTENHKQHIHSDKYFGFLDDFFDQLLFNAWNCVGKALVEKVPSKEELASVPSCNLVSDDLRVWMFPQFFRFVQKRSSCEEVELSEGLQKNVAEVLKTPQRPLAFPIDRMGVKKSEESVEEGGERMVQQLDGSR